LIAGAYNKNTNRRTKMTNPAHIQVTAVIAEVKICSVTESDIFPGFYNVFGVDGAWLRQVISKKELVEAGAAL